MKTYGLELSISLYGCDVKKLRSRKTIEKFLVSATHLIGLETFGKPLFNKDIGEKAGYSFHQFLTTSSIIGKCINKDKVAFITVFSCGMYNADVMANFAKVFFRAKWMRKKSIIHKDI